MRLRESRSAVAWGWARETSGRNGIINTRKVFGVVDLFTILIVGMVSQLYTYRWPSISMDAEPADTEDGLRDLSIWGFWYPREGLRTSSMQIPWDNYMWILPDYFFPISFLPILPSFWGTSDYYHHLHVTVFSVSWLGCVRVMVCLYLSFICRFRVVVIMFCVDFIVQPDAYV